MVRSTAFTVLTVLLACGGGARPSTTPVAVIEATPPATASAKIDEPRAPDPDLHRPPPRKLLDIDWTKVALTDDAAALAVWRRIAPTGADWDDKLEEVPATAARPLAIALLHGGNFLCTRPATGDCAKPSYEVERPADTAGLDDPCLRRLLALWSIDQLDEGEDDADVAAVHDALIAIAGLPPPESQLVAAAIHTVPESNQAGRLEILAAAWRAGQRDLVGDAVGGLDEQHLIMAVRDHHIDGALEILSAEGHRATYLAAVGDEALGTRARTTAIGDLAALGAADRLPGDLITVLTAAVRSRDCSVAAAAARALDQHGDHRFVPRRSRGASPAQLMRSMCVLASYEALLHNDEASLVPGYVAARGLERMTITYDPLSDDDSDGDGDPHTTHSAELLPRSEAMLPEPEDLVRAMQHCTGAICVSDEHEFRFVWSRAGELTRIEVADRPPCVKPAKP